MSTPSMPVQATATRETCEAPAPAHPWRRARYLVRAAVAFVLGGKIALVAISGPAAFASGTAARPAGANAPRVAAPVALAAGAAAPAGGAAVQQPVRSLIEAVQRKQAELDRREQEMARREERLALYEKDVTTKLASLEEIEKRLSVRVKAEQGALDASAESLAKIYAAMKPSEAAPILERLDEPTVLAILRRMKEKQVGEILPLVSRDKAIGLTRSLAERR